MYHDGTVYVTNKPVSAYRCLEEKEHRIYDYSIASDIWNISPTSLRFQVSLATYNNQVVHVYKVCGEERNKQMLKMLCDGEEIHIGTVNKRNASGTVAMGSNDMLIVTDCNLMRVFSNNQMREFSLPSGVSLVDVYFSIAIHNDHLYLTPISNSSRGLLDVHYTSLNQVRTDQPAGRNDPNPILSESNPSRKRGRPTIEGQSTNKRVRSELKNNIFQSYEEQSQIGELQSTGCLKRNLLEWKKLKSIRLNDHANLAVFGKRLITAVPGKHKGVEILAYSPTAECWLPVANTGDSISRCIWASTILPLGNTNDLMLIGGAVDRIPLRSIYKLHLTGMYYVLCM